MSDLLQTNRVPELIITTKDRGTLHMARGSCCSRIFASKIESVIQRCKMWCCLHCSLFQSCLLCFTLTLVAHSGPCGWLERLLKWLKQQRLLLWTWSKQLPAVLQLFLFQCQEGKKSWNTIASKAAQVFKNKKGDWGGRRGFFWESLGGSNLKGYGGDVMSVSSWISKKESFVEGGKNQWSSSLSYILPAEISHVWKEYKALPCSIE